MAMTRYSLKLLLITVLLGSAAALAEDNRKQAMHACIDADSPPASVVAGCSQLLDSEPALTTQLRLNAHMQRAVAYDRLGEYNLAIDEFGRAIKMAPTSTRLHQYLGVTYIQLGNFRKAVRALAEAIELDGNNAQAYFYRGFSYAKMDQHDRAVADYNRALELQPDFPAVASHRGQSYMRLGDCERAVIDFDASIELAATDGLVYWNRAECHFDLGHAEAALQDHRRSIELMSDNADVHNASCWTKGLLGDGAGALVDCNEALRLQPGVAAYHDSRALAYYQLQQYELALADAAAAMQDPGWEVYLLRAAIYQRQGELKLAKADYRKARRLQRDKPLLQQRIRALGWESGTIGE
jgi:Tfp pilus assembly protein PilF